MLAKDNFVGTDDNNIDELAFRLYNSAYELCERV